MCRVLIRWTEKPRHLKDDDFHEMNRTWRGDPIVAMPDGHKWGSAERLPNFVSLDLEGVPVEEIRKFIVHEESNLVSHTGKPVIRRKRAYNIAVEKLPTAIFNALKRDGVATATMADLKGRIIHKATGLAR